MRGSRSPVADEYNEDTDKANDSDDDQYEESKLVIDEDPNSSISASENSKSSTGTPSKDNSKSVDDNFTAPEPKSEKPKGRRGMQRKNDKTDGAKPNGKLAKAEKEKPPPNKPGRKRKEKSTAKSNNRDTSSPPSSAGSPTDPYKFDTEEGIAATVTGKHANKGSRSEVPVATKDAETDYDWRSTASLTEPEHLAPCEPGTQVCLEGIVWQETNNGVLIVNVTWRGKTYMGTLLDATKHDWSPPSCDSPVAELEGRTPKGRGKRSRVPLSDTFKDINERKLRKEMRKQSGATHPPSSPAKSDQGKRKNKNSESETGEPVNKRGRVASRNNTGPTPSSPPVLIECPEPNCGKKYKQMNGLRYHQKNAHQDTMSHVSDSLSETEKQEPLPSPDANKQSKRKTKSESAKPMDSKTSKSDPEETEHQFAETSTTTQPNTTSVITSTTTQISNSSQQSSVPVAAIPPQVVKPTSVEDQSKNNTNQQQTQSMSSIPATTSVNRSLPSAPKLFPKSSSNSMAPISTITSQGVYNPSLKPIQPKPTILGESTPNPTLTELKDHKKLKRKKSASKDDITNGTGSPFAADAFNRSFTQKSEAERKSPLNQPMPAVLQSPSYSDISEEGEIRNARREMLSNSKTGFADTMCPPPAMYPIATVSPQKSIPQLTVVERERNKPNLPSHSPVAKPVIDERMRREAEAEMKQQREIEYLNRHYQMAGLQPGFAAEIQKDQILQMAVRERERERQQRQSVSPKPPSIKSLPSQQSKDFEAKASSDRMQLLKDNKDMKPQTLGLHPQEMTAADLQAHQREEMNRYLMFQRMQLNQQKRESLQAHSPAHKSATTAAVKANDAARTSRSSPSTMPPQLSDFMPFMANPLYPFPGLHGLGAAMPPQFLQPGMPYPGLPNMKDVSRTAGASQMFTKPDHKIHELESMRSAKSPRPPTDRPSSTKSHQVLPQHQSVLSTATAAGLSGALYYQPK